MTSSEGRDFSERPPDGAADRELWIRARGPAAADPGACLSPLDLAAFVDGRLAEERRPEIEMHLAGCGSCIQAVREIRALLAEADATPMLVPRGARTRARRLIEGSRRAADETPTHPLLWLLGRGGLVAAACVGVCVIGYLTGLRASSHVDPAALAEEMSLGTFDSLAEDGSDLDRFLAPEDASL